MNILTTGIETFLGGVFSLLPIMNPFSTLPVFVALTAGMSVAERRDQARRAGLFAAAILLVALIAGNLIMQFFGISVPALRVAGGLIIAVIGFRALFPEPTPAPVTGDARGKADVALIPIALPSLSGPGSIAVVIAASAQVNQMPGWPTKLAGNVAMALAIVAVAAIAWLVLRSCDLVIRVLGDDGIESIKRIMGFLLVCVGVQFVATGVIAFAPAVGG